MNRAFGQIEQHLISGINLTELAQTAAVTPAHFSRVFKKLTGLNLIAYINHKRLNKARDLLYNTDYTINIIAEQCGFESLPHFHRTFKSSVHLTPAAYRKKARETDI